MEVARQTIALESAHVSDWQSDLDARLGKEAREKQEQVSRIEANKASVVPFIEGKVWPAFGKVSAVLQRHGRNVDVKSYENTFRTHFSSRNIFHVFHASKRELDYTIEVLVNEYGAFARAETNYSRGGDYAKDQFSIRSGVRSTGWNDSVSDITQDEVTQSVLEEYKKRAND